MCWITQLGLVLKNRNFLTMNVETFFIFYSHQYQFNVSSNLDRIKCLSVCPVLFLFKCSRSPQAERGEILLRKWNTFLCNELCIRDHAKHDTTYPSLKKYLFTAISTIINNKNSTLYIYYNMSDTLI